MKYLLILLLCLPAFLTVAAQDAYPTANPTMTYVDEDGMEVDDTQYDGSAPLVATFKANPENVGTYTPLYEWRFTRVGEEKPLLVRYEEETQYTFSQSGSFPVELLVSFVQGTDTIAYNMDTPFNITISESKLEVPNAFTPNGDGINDVFRVKEGYKSIVSFKARVFSRWGKKLYEWDDPEGGWDGRSGGSNVPTGPTTCSSKPGEPTGKTITSRKPSTCCAATPKTAQVPLNSQHRHLPIHGKQRTSLHRNSRRKGPQPEKRRCHPATPEPECHHGTERVGKKFFGLRHALCRRPTPLYRNLLGLRTQLPGQPGTARRGQDFGPQPRYQH